MFDKNVNYVFLKKMAMDDRLFRYYTVKIQTLAEFTEVCEWRNLLCHCTTAISWMALDGVISCAFRGVFVNIRN